MASGQIVYIRRVANENTAPNRIRELREAKGIAQNELARMANTEPSTINKLEKGKRGLDQNWMRRLAPLLGVTPAELLPIEDNPLMLDDDERALIAARRAANSTQRDTFRKVAEAILPFTPPPRENAG